MNLLAMVTDSKSIARYLRAIVNRPTCLAAHRAAVPRFGKCRPTPKSARRRRVAKALPSTGFGSATPVCLAPRRWALDYGRNLVTTARVGAGTLIAWRNGNSLRAAVIDHRRRRILGRTLSLHPTRASVDPKASH
jgi:hypothetical protein